MTATGFSRLTRGRHRFGEADNRTESWIVTAIADGVILVGLAAFVSGLIGLGDDRGDALVLILTGMLAVPLGVLIRRSFRAPHRPSGRRVIGSIGTLWLVLSVVGASLYMMTGTIESPEEALFESVAGFTTTKLSLLDPDTVSTGVIVWRALTQWIGGLLAMVFTAIALPGGLRDTLLVKRLGDTHDAKLAPNDLTGRIRVLVLYSLLSVVLWIAFVITGAGTIDSLVLAASTASTGGYAPVDGSLISYGAPTRMVAFVGMIAAGAGVYLGWLIIRRKWYALVRSGELWLYFGIIGGAGLMLVLLGDQIAVTDAMFTSASMASTTGFAVTNWAAWSDGALAILLVIVGIGSMAGSAGAGFRVRRALLLTRAIRRELQRQLDPRRVVLVRMGGGSIDNAAVDRATATQFVYVAVTFLAAIALALAGRDVMEAIWLAVSAMSTAGPSIGIVGVSGDASQLGSAELWVLMMAMIGGRLALIPVVATLIWLTHVRDSTRRRMLRRGRRE